MRSALTAALAAALCLVCPGPAGGVLLAPVDGSHAGGFDQPTYVTSDPADAGRLFVAEKPGRIVLVENGSRTTFLQFPPGTVLAAPDNELGLFSIALAPDFPETGRFYAFYTRDGAGEDAADLQIDEFFAEGDAVDWDTRRPVLTIPVPNEPVSVHNGGQLQFGPDGMLYISVGDGANTGAGDVDGNAQSTATLLGKILRLDPAGEEPGEYTVPAGNPFAGPVAGRDEIWSLGLRNPWRFSFDRLTGDLTIGDVGQLSWEEVDLDPAPRAGRGVNFGWDCLEGTHPWPTPATGCEAAFTDPILEFPNPVAGPASVTGGYVVRDQRHCALEGRYVYAELFSGQLRSLVPQVPAATGDAPLGLTVDWPVSFGEDAAGRVYVVSLSGAVYRLDPAPGECDSPPAPTCGGQTVTLSGEGRLRGTRGADVILGSPGSDRIEARGGRDLVCAGGGGDRVSGGGGGDRLFGQRGRDRLIGGAGADRCRGGRGRDRLRRC